MSNVPVDHATPANSDDAKAGRVASLISGLLRWGVRVSFVLVVLGSVLSFARGQENGTAAADLARLTGSEGAFPRSAGWILSGAVALQGTPLIVAGLLLLIVTPILRVAVSIVVFAGQGDRTFVLVTAGVLILLALSFLLGSLAR